VKGAGVSGGNGGGPKTHHNFCLKDLTCTSQSWLKKEIRKGAGKRLSYQKEELSRPWKRRAR